MPTYVLMTLFFGHTTHTHTHTYIYLHIFCLMDDIFTNVFTCVCVYFSFICVQHANLKFD
jgi:hypothetical protein